MRSLLVLIMLFVAVALVSTDGGPAPSVYYRVTIPFQKVVQGKTSPQVSLIKKKDQDVIRFTNLKGLWKALPSYTAYSGPLSPYTVGDEVEPDNSKSRKIRKKLLSQLGEIEFALPAGTCLLRDQPENSFVCQNLDGKGLLSEVQIGKRKVQLKMLSTGILKSEQLSPEGELRAFEKYLVRVQINFGYGRDYSFVMYSKPEWVQSPHKLRFPLKSQPGSLAQGVFKSAF